MSFPSCWNFEKIIAARQERDRLAAEACSSPGEAQVPDPPAANCPTCGRLVYVEGLAAQVELAGVERARMAAVREAWADYDAVLHGDLSVDRDQARFELAANLRLILEATAT